MNASKTDRLSYQDATFAYFDRPEFPYNVGSVGIYEGRMTFDDYVAHIASRVDGVPRYRQRMVTVPFSIDHPAWHPDPDFNVRNHIKRVVLPEPAGEEELARFAGEFFSIPLDRDKPLWQICLVENLSGGRSAHVAKVHHCLVDGVGGVELLGAVMDLEPSPPPVGREPLPPAPPLPGRAARVVDALFDRLQAQIDLAESVAMAVVEPRRAASSARSIVSSLRSALPHFGLSKRTPWRTHLSRPDRIAWQSVPFDDVHTIAKRLGGTINDAVLTILAGALRRYMQSHGHDDGGPLVRVLIPVNVRSDDEEHSLGNRVSFMLAGLPLGIDDPIARFGTIHHDVSNLKATSQPEGVERLFRVIAMSPPPMQRLLGAQLRMPNFLADMVCTNVPGPLTPLYCMGHRLIDHYPWVPIGWRMGFGTAVMSYNEALYFSFTADRSVMPDLDVMSALLHESFVELRHAAGVGQDGFVSGDGRAPAGADLGTEVPTPLRAVVFPPKN